MFAGATVLSADALAKMLRFSVFQARPSTSAECPSPPCAHERLDPMLIPVCLLALPLPLSKREGRLDGVDNVEIPHFNLGTS